MDLTQLSSQLKAKTDFNAGSTLGLRDINSVTGIVDNSVTSLQALIVKTDISEYDDIDTTNFDVTGITSGYDNQAFVFDLKKDYKLNLSSDITDHYVEDNVAIQDHIGLKPIIIEVVGSIGEVRLNEKDRFDRVTKDKGNLTAEKEFSAVDSYLNRMGSLTSFAPNIMNQARDIYDSAKNVYNTANKTINFVKDPTGKDKKPTGSGIDYTERYTESQIEDSWQFYWIDWFKTQWWKRASFSIVTPYGVFGDMYIMELNATQPEQSRYVTNLNIKFKQIRKAKIVRYNRKVAQPMETQVSKNTETKEEKRDITQRELGGVPNKGINNIGANTADNPYAINFSNNTAVADFNVGTEITISQKADWVNQQLLGTNPITSNGEGVEL